MFLGDKKRRPKDYLSLCGLPTIRNEAVRQFDASSITDQFIYSLLSKIRKIACSI